MKGALSICLALFLCIPPLSAFAETYRVGEGAPYSKVGYVAERLEPGDVVEITGDLCETFTLTRHGRHDAPITIRGVYTQRNGRDVRPAITAEPDKRPGIEVRGAWYVIENLSLTGANGTPGAESALHVRASHVTVRNCRIHHNRQGLSAFGDIRDLTVEFCEFDSNGAGSNRHSIYVISTAAGGVFTLQHCWLHDGVGGVLVKTRFPENVIRYNWFESAFYAMFKLVSLQKTPRHVTDERLPHVRNADIVGNVFFGGWSPGPQWSAITIGGESDGIEGDVNIAHNLFISTNAAWKPALGESADRPTPLLAHGNIDHIRVYNNVFLDYGTAGSTIYHRGWVTQSARTERFVERRGGGEPVIEASNNWICEKAMGIPQSFRNTTRGMNPRFMDLAEGDFRPVIDSPLNGAGLSDLPRGRLVPLAPEYEPQKGIRADRKPRRRPQADPPSIGPFECPERAQTASPR